MAGSADIQKQIAALKEQLNNASSMSLERKLKADIAALQTQLKAAQALEAQGKPTDTANLTAQIQQQAQAAAANAPDTSGAGGAAAITAASNTAIQQMQAADMQQKLQALNAMPATTFDEISAKYAKAKELQQQAAANISNVDSRNANTSPVAQASLAVKNAADQLQAVVSASISQIVQQNPNSPILQQELQKYNSGQAVNPMFADYFQKLNSYHQQGAAAPGKLTLQLMQSTEKQWQQDAKDSPLMQVAGHFNDVAQAMAPLIAGTMFGPALAGAAGFGGQTAATVAGGGMGGITSSAQGNSALNGIIAGAAGGYMGYTPPPVMGQAFPVGNTPFGPDPLAPIGGATGNAVNAAIGGGDAVGAALGNAGVAAGGGATGLLPGVIGGGAGALPGVGAGGNLIDSILNPITGGGGITLPGGGGNSGGGNNPTQPPTMSGNLGGLIEKLLLNSGAPVAINKNTKTVTAGGGGDVTNLNALYAQLLPQTTVAGMTPLIDQIYKQGFEANMPTLYNTSNMAGMSPVASSMQQLKVNDMNARLAGEAAKALQESQKTQAGLASEIAKYTPQAKTVEENVNNTIDPKVLAFLALGQAGGYLNPGSGSGNGGGSQSIWDIIGNVGSNIWNAGGNFLGIGGNSGGGNSGGGNVAAAGNMSTMPVINVGGVTKVPGDPNLMTTMPVMNGTFQTKY